MRGARIALVDDDGVRANMTASWLAQMGWDVHVLEGVSVQSFDRSGEPVIRPALPAVRFVNARQLADWLATDAEATQVVDVSASAAYVKKHIPGAWFALRSQLGEALKALPARRRLVLTCTASFIAAQSAADASVRDEREVWVLEGGNQAWIAAGLPTDSGEARLASPRIDRYRRPYEGTDNAREAMQAYLDWEFGLIAQLERDGTHGFEVLSAEAIAAQG